MSLHLESYFEPGWLGGAPDNEPWLTQAGLWPYGLSPHGDSEF